MCDKWEACETEVFNYKGLNTKVCSLPAKSVQGATGGFVAGKFVVAGGHLKTTKERTDKIYQMGSAAAVATMIKKRFLAASCVVGNQLWNTGGVDQNGLKLRSTETFDPNSGSVDKGPDLPVASNSHCMCYIESISTAMFIGGISNRDKTWSYRVKNLVEDWVPGPRLNQGRYNHVCGAIEDSADESKTIVIVAGGWNTNISDLKSTEILIINSSIEEERKWIQGPDLPFRIYNAAGVVSPDGKSFLAIGGRNYFKRQNEDSIYKLQCHNLKCEWENMDQKLKVARSLAVADFVPDSVLDSL